MIIIFKVKEQWTLDEDGHIHKQFLVAPPSHIKTFRLVSQPPLHLFASIYDGMEIALDIEDINK